MHHRRPCCSVRPTTLLFLAVVYGRPTGQLPWNSRPRRCCCLAAEHLVLCEIGPRSWLVIVLATSMLDFVLARSIDLTLKPAARPANSPWRAVLPATSAFSFYFKYANFFLSSLEQTLQAAGCQASFPVLKILAPIGISFYTFEAISYVVDVYQRKIRAERNPLNFMLFITFFPHLVSGPIVRGRDFLPQIGRTKKWSWPRAHLGVSLLALGLFKKMAIGDRMALFVEPVFAHPDLYRTSSLWIAMIAFTIQLYLRDFFAATPTWLSERLTCSATSSPRTFGCRTLRRTSRTFGDAGTSPCRAGSATTCSSRLEAVAARHGGSCLNLG